MLQDATQARLRDLAEARTAHDLPIEYSEKPNLGHVLVVNEGLEDAVEWLRGLMR